MSELFSVLYGIVFLIIIRFLCWRLYLYVYFIYKEWGHCGFFISYLTMTTLFLSKIVFYRPMFLRKSSKYSSTRLAQSFSVILTFFTHIVLSSLFYRGCWRTSMSCFTAAHSRGKQWWLQIWSSCCKFLTIVGPWMHVFYLNPFMPQYPHTNSPNWSPHISFKN